jgi:hypothetical protein
MIIMNQFIGVIMNSIQESHRELEQSLSGKSSTPEDMKQMLKDLDKKVDDLKSDLSRIRDIV